MTKYKRWKEKGIVFRLAPEKDSIFKKTDETSNSFVIYTKVYKSIVYRLKELINDVGKRENGKSFTHLFVTRLHDKGVDISYKSIRKYLAFEEYDKLSEGSETGLLFHKKKNSPMPPLTLIYDIAKVLSIDPGWLIDYRYPSKHFLREVQIIKDYCYFNNISELELCIKTGDNKYIPLPSLEEMKQYNKEIEETLNKTH